MPYRLKRANRMHDERNLSMVKDIDKEDIAKKLYLWEMRALTEYEELSGDAMLIYCCITEPADTLTNNLPIHKETISKDYGISLEEIDIALRELVDRGIIDRSDVVDSNGYKAEYRINKIFWNKVLTNRDEMLEEEIRGIDQFMIFDAESYGIGGK